MGMAYNISIYDLIGQHYYASMHMFAIIYWLGEDLNLIITSPYFYKKHIVS